LAKQRIFVIEQAHRTGRGDGGPTVSFENQNCFCLLAYTIQNVYCVSILGAGFEGRRVKALASLLVTLTRKASSALSRTGLRPPSSKGEVSYVLNLGEWPCGGIGILPKADLG
jgi:hypothetical protein